MHSSHRSQSQDKVLEQCISQSQFSSSSSQITCCSEQSQYIDDPFDQDQNGDFNDFKGLFPLQINGVFISRVTWEMFTAIPNQNSQWKAHCYWTVGYNYDFTMKKMKKSNNIRYKLQVNVQCCLSNRSWVKNKWNRLLEHETGHYLIGCLCALDFKHKAEKTKFTKNYRQESSRLFQEIFSQHLQLEKLYDDETNHSQNIPKQKEWNTFIKNELMKY